MKITISINGLVYITGKNYLCSIFITMSKNNFNISVTSEIGELEAVIVHTPGLEVENMTPENVERALYSDILNLSFLKTEYAEFKSVLDKHARTFEVRELLAGVLKNEKVKASLISEIFEKEAVEDNKDFLIQMEEQQLSTLLIEGLKMKKDTLTKFLNKDFFSLTPLHNLLYTRDIAIAFHHHVLTGQMANKVRAREAKIMEAIFDFHPFFNTATINPKNKVTSPEIVTYEGGDILIARQDITLIGMGARTSSQGIDFIVSQLLLDKEKHHIIVQELPTNLESYIHLDMVFTLLSQNECMVFEPLILRPNRYRTIHICIENGKVNKIETVDNILSILKTLGMELKPIFCGGTDTHIQEREQWHSGANFFALAPGKITGYERNIHTIETLNKNGFEVLKAHDINSGKAKVEDYKKYVVTIKGSELSRGGGGARCMTMPVKRKKVDWGK